MRCTYNPTREDVAKISKAGEEGDLSKQTFNLSLVYLIKLQSIRRWQIL